MVDKYAKENKYKVVLRYNSEPVNAAKPEDVLRGINSPVIWHADAIDITPAIAKLLQQNVTGEPVASAAGQKPIPIPPAYTPPVFATKASIAQGPGAGVQAGRAQGPSRDAPAGLRKKAIHPRDQGRGR